MTWRNSLGGLNPRHHNLPDELKAAILANMPVDYEFYLRFKDVYSSKRLKVIYACEVCGAEHMSDFKHLNKRKVVTAPVCPKCVMKVVGSDEAWRKRNSESQARVQCLPEQKAKNAAGVSKFWANNPDKLEKMRENVIATNQREDVKAKLRARGGWNGRGISGDYLSKWGWLQFDSSYELATIVALESREDILSVKRGPIIKYEFEGVSREYFVDFEVVFVSGLKWWCEVKSGYVGKHVEKLGKLREKLRAALELVKGGHADKVVLITERNAKEVLGTVMPRDTYRNSLFQKLHDKIIFARASDEEKYR